MERFLSILIGFFKFMIIFIMTIPAILFNFFLVFSFGNPNKSIVLINESYWILFNTLIGIGSCLYIFNAQKNFDRYKKWKEEAIYYQQQKKGIEDRNSKEIVEVRQESFYDKFFDF